MSEGAGQSSQSRRERNTAGPPPTSFRQQNASQRSRSRSLSSDGRRREAPADQPRSMSRSRADDSTQHMTYNRSRSMGLGGDAERGDMRRAYHRSSSNSSLTSDWERGPHQSPLISRPPSNAQRSDSLSQVPTIRQRGLSRSRSRSRNRNDCSPMRSSSRGKVTKTERSIASMPPSFYTSQTVPARRSSNSVSADPTNTRRSRSATRSNCAAAQIRARSLSNASRASGESVGQSTNRRDGKTPRTPSSRSTSSRVQSACRSAPRSRKMSAFSVSEPQLYQNERQAVNRSVASAPIFELHSQPSGRKASRRPSKNRTSRRSTQAPIVVVDTSGFPAFIAEGQNHNEVREDARQMRMNDIGDDNRQHVREELVSTILQETQQLVHNILNERMYGENPVATADLSFSAGELFNSRMPSTEEQDERVNLRAIAPALESSSGDSTIVVPFATAVPCDHESVTTDDMLSDSETHDEERAFRSLGDSLFQSEYDENNEFAHCAGLLYSNGQDVRQDDVPLGYIRGKSRNGKSHQRNNECNYDDQNTVIVHDNAKLVDLAGHLSRKWKGDLQTPALARRVRDFQFAQEKRRKKYGKERPWGIMGMYDHLSAIRVDVEWAEDAAWRRFHNEPYLPWAMFNDDKRTGLNKPFFTICLMCTCLAMLLASLGANGWKLEAFAVNPMLGPSAAVLLHLGAKDSDLIVNDNQAWRLVTPIFLHAGIIHFVLNMIALWLVGSAVERSHGFASAAILFTVPAIGGIVLSALLLPQYITVGASGGIFGLTGACLADITMNWALLFSSDLNKHHEKFRHFRVLIMIFLDVVINVFIGLTPFVDNFTHLAGMVYGFLCGFTTMQRLSMHFFGVKQSTRTCRATKSACSPFLGLILTVVAIMTTAVLLLGGNGTTTPCPECRYVSCMPMPPWSDQKWWYCDDCNSATGEVSINSATGVYDSVNMTCPDGTPFFANLTNDPASNHEFVNLPQYCRQNCKDRFSQ